MAGPPGVHAVTQGPPPTGGSLGGNIRPEGSTGGVGPERNGQLLPGGARLSRFVAAQNPTVTPSEPLTLVVAVVVFGDVAAVAAFGPARRATRVDPAIFLKGG